MYRSDYLRVALARALETRSQSQWHDLISGDGSSFVYIRTRKNTRWNPALDRQGCPKAKHNTAYDDRLASCDRTIVKCTSCTDCSFYSNFTVKQTPVFSEVRTMKRMRARAVVTTFRFLVNYSQLVSTRSIYVQYWLLFKIFSSNH